MSIPTLTIDPKCESDGGSNPTPSDPLAKLDKARKMLAESRTLLDVKKVKDIAESAKFYAKAAKLGHEAQTHAAGITLWAGRKGGQMLSQLRKSKSSGVPASVAGTSEYRKALKDAAIPERTAQRWQKLAEPDDTTFQHAIEKITLADKELTTAAVLREIHHRSPKPEKNCLDQFMDWLGTRMPNPAPCDGEPVGTCLMRMVFELPKTPENEKRFDEAVAYEEKISKFFGDHAAKLKNKPLCLPK